jgi:hypothetical protein
MAPMARVSFDASQRWAYEIARFRLIGSIRRDWLDHVVISDEQHIPVICPTVTNNITTRAARTSLKKDAPILRAQRVGQVLASPISGFTTEFECPAGTEV